jgi:phosphoglycolate phosphatase
MNDHLKNRRQNRPIKAIVFDLDGTLIDSAPDIHTASVKLLEELGHTPVNCNDITKMCGDGARKLVSRLMESINQPVRGDVLDHLSERFLYFYEGCEPLLTRPYPKAVQTLAHLIRNDYVLGLCTNRPQASTLEILRRFNLSKYFSAVLGGDVLDNIKKPDPRHLLSVIERLDAAPSETVMLGDGAHDISAAKAAGVFSIVAAYGYLKTAPEKMGGDGILSSLKDLPGVLSQISN